MKGSRIAEKIEKEEKIKQYYLNIKKRKQQKGNFILNVIAKNSL